MELSIKLASLIGVSRLQGGNIIIPRLLQIGNYGWANLVCVLTQICYAINEVMCSIGEIEGFLLEQGAAACVIDDIARHIVEKEQQGLCAEFKSLCIGTNRLHGTHDHAEQVFPAAYHNPQRIREAVIRRRQQRHKARILLQ